MAQFKSWDHRNVAMAADLKRITSILQRMDHWRLQTKSVSNGCQQVSEVGTDLRAVRPRGAGHEDRLPVESACHGECRFSVMFGGVALSEKSPYLGGSRVRLSLW